MDCLPQWSAVSYNALSLVQTRRLRHILSELRWNSIVCIQGTQRRTNEQVVQYTIPGFNIIEWGCSTHSGKSAGLVIAVRNKLFSFKHMVRVFTPPEEFIGRAGAIRLKRGDVDFLVVNVYAPVNPHLQKDKQYIVRLWAWVGHVLSLAPARCVPVLCTDANARLGRGTRVPSVGTFDAVAENFNGEQLRELLTEHHMVATNTFFPAGDTYFGNFGRNSRIDYVCIPQSMLQAVERCNVLYAQGKRLQLIPAVGKRDHMPAQCVFRHKLLFELCDSASGWDRDALAQGVLQGFKREQFLAECEKELGKVDVSSYANQSPDAIWGVVNAAVLHAAKSCYAVQRKHIDDPEDTRQAHADMVQQRAHLVSLPQPERLAYVHSDSMSRDFVSAIFAQWQALSRYWRARKQLDILAKRDRHNRLQTQLDEFNSAWGKRDFSRMWRLARELSRKQVGPKKRVFNRPVSQRPSVDDWERHLAKRGCDGGWEAERMSEVPTRMSTEPLHSAEAVAGVASEDFRALFSQVHRAKLRRAVPPWSAPAEVWRQLFHPTYHRSKLRSGVDYVPFAQRAPSFKSWMWVLMLSIRRWEQTPAKWQHSMSFQLDKRNGKLGCDGIRLVNCLDPCGNAFFRHIWQQCAPQSYRHYAAGYYSRKSRLEPICQQHILSARLRNKRISHARSFYDVQNAFPSQSRAAISEALDNIARPRNRSLLEQRHSEALVRVCDGCGEADFRPGSGTLQGDGPSAQLFLEPYHPQLDKWANDLGVFNESKILFATCEVIYGPLEQDLAMSSYADDVSRISLGHNPEALRQALQVANASLDRRLWEIQLVQNIGKQEHVVFFGGKHSHQHYHTVYQDSYLPGSTVQSARYLGGRAHYAGRTHEEVALRIQAAKVAWARMGSFWFRSGANTRSKLLVYKALVQSTLLSGLEVLVLEKQKYQQLDGFILRTGRKLLQGRACNKELQSDGSIRYTACSSKAVWKMLGLCPSQLELRVRRLRWYQQLASNISEHICILMAMFGRLGFDDVDTVGADGKIRSSANPWALQFQEDMQALAAIDDGQSLLDRLQGCMVLVFTQYSGDFLAVDVSALRGTFAPNCIPPPGWVPSPVEEVFDDDVDDVEHTFICDCTLADGRPCQQGFPTAQALAVHKSSTKGGTHDNLSDISKVSITNKCPWCKNVFSSVLSARNHIRRTLGRGYCGGTGSHVVFEVQQPESLQCRVCEVCFDSVEDLLDHVSSHVVLPTPNAAA